MPKSKTKTTTKKNQNMALIALSVMAVALVLLTLLVSRGLGTRDSGAWDCDKYNFTVQKNGEVFVHNNSQYAEPQTLVDVNINNNFASTLRAPATQPFSQPVKIGQVTVPQDGVFTWTAVAHADRRCSDSGSYTAPTPLCNYVELKVN